MFPFSKRSLINILNRFLFFRLDDVKNVISRLYEAMNVQDYQVSKEVELNTQLEQLQQELLPLEQVSTTQNFTLLNCDI